MDWFKLRKKKGSGLCFTKELSLLLSRELKSKTSPPLSRLTFERQGAELAAAAAHLTQIKNALVLCCSCDCSACSAAVGGGWHCSCRLASCRLQSAVSQGWPSIHISSCLVPYTPAQSSFSTPQICVLYFLPEYLHFQPNVHFSLAFEKYLGKKPAGKMITCCRSLLRKLELQKNKEASL